MGVIRKERDAASHAPRYRYPAMQVQLVWTRETDTVPVRRQLFYGESPWAQHTCDAVHNLHKTQNLSTYGVGTEHGLKTP